MGGKRKDGPGGQKGGQAKKNKQGSHQGRWQTTHQKAKLANLAEMGNKIEAGDVGIWVTCQRKLERKAMNELVGLCDDICEKMYGIPKPKWDEDEEEVKPTKKSDGNDDDDEEDEDIEALIKKELEGMGNVPDAEGNKPPPKRRGPKRKTFLTIDLKCESVFFIKTFAPVEPVALVRALCEEAAGCRAPRDRRVRYVNRLTPVVQSSKATDMALGILARSVLGKSFKLRELEANEIAAEKKEEEKDKAQDSEATVTEAKVDEVAEVSEVKEDVAPPAEPTVEFPPHTYAIRTTRRNHNTLTSDQAVEKVAGQISYPHRVRLSNPDKTVLVELFRNIAGMSVVDGAEYERFKKFNMDSIYKAALEKVAEGGEVKTGEVKTGETQTEEVKAE